MKMSYRSIRFLLYMIHYRKEGLETVVKIICLWKMGSTAYDMEKTGRDI